jgi:hypothetical protein
VYVYNLRDRKWARMSINHVSKLLGSRLRTVRWVVICLMPLSGSCIVEDMIIVLVMRFETELVKLIWRDDDKAELQRD